MKKLSWIFVLVVALSIIVACAPVPPAQLIIDPTGGTMAPSVSFPTDGTVILSEDLVLTGSGGFGNQVRVVINDTVAGTTRVGQSGNWSVKARLGGPGSYNIIVQSLYPNGTVAQSTGPIGVSIPSPEPEPVADASATDSGTDNDSNGTSDAASSDSASDGDSGDGSDATATESSSASDAAAGGALNIVFPIDQSDVIVGQLTIRGAGSPGGQVDILDGDTVLGTAEVDGSGEWAFTFEPTAGDHQYGVRAAGGDATDQSIAVSIVGAGEADCDNNPGINRGGDYIVGTCDTLVDIAELLNLDIDALIAANSDLPNIDLIYPGQSVTLP